MAHPPPRIHGSSRLVRVRGGVRGDGGEVVLGGLTLGQVTAHPLEPTLQRVHMRVDEAGREQSARQVDLARAGTRQVGGLRARGRAQEHAGQPAVGDHRRAGAGVPVPVEDRAVPEHERGHGVFLSGAQSDG
jgi:hypothetical protein